MQSIDATYNYGSLLHVRFAYKRIRDREQPVMILQGRTDSAFQIPLDTAHKYTDDVELIETATKVCNLLGLGSNKNTVHRVCDIILNHLQELVEMPPTRSERQQSLDPEPRIDGMKFSAGGVALV